MKLRKQKIYSVQALRTIRKNLMRCYNNNNCWNTNMRAAIRPVFITRGYSIKLVLITPGYSIGRDECNTVIRNLLTTCVRHLSPCWPVEEVENKLEECFIVSGSIHVIFNADSTKLFVLLESLKLSDYGIMYTYVNTKE